jgi:flagellar biosynthesis anti-sigma factor FlgM
MKIDPRIQTTGGLQGDPVKNANKSANQAPDAKSANAASTQSEDTIQISSRHTEVQQLTAQIANVPDVRAERIAPLQAAVQQKTYNPDSGKVADALLSEQAGKSAKA